MAAAGLSRHDASGRTVTSMWDNVVADPSSGCPSDIMFSFDVGGRDNVFSRMQADGGGVAFAGLALESNEGSDIIDSTANNSTNSSLLVLDSFSTLIRDSRGAGSYIGLFLSTDATSGEGCADTTVEGGSFDANRWTGIEAFSGAIGTHITGASASGNLGYGITLVPNGSTISGTTIENVSATDNGNTGLVILSGSAKTVIRNIDVSGGGAMGVYAADGFDSSGLVALTGNPVSSVYLAAGAFTTNISYGNIHAALPRSVGIYVAPENTVNVDHTAIVTDAVESTGLELTGGICNIEHTVLRGPSWTLPPQPSH